MSPRPRHQALGTLAEAEGAVQEAWIRLQRSDVGAIDDVTGWLVSTTSRIAVDVLRCLSRRTTWIPEQSINRRK